MSTSPDERPPGTRIVIKLARRATVAALFLCAAALGTVGGVLFAYGGDLPEITALDNYRPNTITRLLASNGDVIGEFASGTAADVKNAVAAAKAAFPAWSRTTPQERYDILKKASDEVLARKEELGRILSREESKILA